MLHNSQEIYDKLSRFLALTTSIKGDQAIHLNSGIQSLFLQLADNITLEQKVQFEKNIKRSHFLAREIIGYWEVYDVMLTLLCQPTQVDLEEVDIYTVISHAIEDTKRYVGNYSEFVAVTATENEISIQSLYSLLRHAISSLLVYAYFLAPSNQIFISVTQTEVEITLKVSGHNPSSSQTDIINEGICHLSIERAALIISGLGGSFNWEKDKVIPGELIIRLLKKSAS